MHQGYIFRVWSVVLLVVHCYRFCWCSFCLLALFHVPSWGWGGRRGSTCLLLLFSALDMDHCSSQLKSGEHPGPSTHRHTTDPHSPPAHTDSDTNMHPLANTYTYKNIHMHTNMYKLTQANTKLNTHIIIALSFVHYYDTWTHTDIVQFYFLPAHKFGVGGVGEDAKLNHTTKSWNRPYLIGPITNQFLYLHYSILSILCACSLSLSRFHTSFFSTAALHKHEKGSCSAISAIQATRDQGFNPKKFFGLKTKTIIKISSWWKKALTKSLKNWHTSLQARHFSNQCDIYKVAKMGCRNWSHNHCNWSDTKLSPFTTTRAVLRELSAKKSPFPI